jgi:hypothetical protein
MLVYGPNVKVCVGTRKEATTGNPNPDYISTSYTEQANITMRMAMRPADERIAANVARDGGWNSNPAVVDG